jgi:hypothetical protein
MKDIFKLLENKSHIELNFSFSQGWGHGGTPLSTLTCKIVNNKKGTIKNITPSDYMGIESGINDLKAKVLKEIIEEE